MWSRGKMLALLAGAAAVALAAAAGLVLLVVSALHPAAAHPAGPAAATTAGASAAGGAVATGTGSAGHRTADPGPAGAGPDAAAGPDARDVLADGPMPTVDADAAHPGRVSLTAPGQILLPAAARSGPAGVPTGFPHTPAGALAQLAAIDQAALQSGSLAGAREVLAGWSAPGGPSGQSWSLIRGLADLLGTAGLSGGGSPRLALVLTPLMGLIKGSVGADFVVPCVDFELDVTLQQTARGAVADCQRMVWTGPDSPAGRWMIGPGPEPAAAPSVWPDTDAAIAAGYADLRPADHG